MTPLMGAYAWGLFAVGMVFLAACIAGWTFNIFTIFVGADRRPSTSLFQFWIWTLTVVCVYVALYAIRVSKGVPYAIDYIPASVLLAMGLSVTTAAGAKAITVSYVNSASIDKQPVQVPTTNQSGNMTARKPALLTNRHPVQALLGLRYLLTDDDGKPSLVKIQMLFWTLLATIIYLKISTQLVGSIDAMTATEFKAAVQKSPSSYGLPDIGTALMVLMGISQGAYLGLKLTTTTTPKLIAIDKSAVEPGKSFTLSGTDLGDGNSAGQIMIDNMVAQTEGKRDWTNTKVTASLDKGWDGVPAGRSTISVAYGGRQSNSLDIFLPPKLTGISVRELSLQGGQSFTIYGRGLGDENAGRIMINGLQSPVTINRWTVTQIDAVLNKWPDGSTGDCLVSISVSGLTSNGEKVRITP